MIGSNTHTQEVMAFLESAVFLMQMKLCVRNQARRCDSFPGYAIRPETFGLTKPGQKDVLKDFTDS